MTGFTLDTRQTSLLNGIVAAATEPSDDALPWMVLEQIKDLLHADEVSWMGFDTLMPHVFLAQFVSDAEGRGYDPETPTEALDNPFWQTYWDSPCSYPDRTGDYSTTFKGSDLESDREARHRTGERRPAVDLIAVLPGQSSGRHYRLSVWRSDGRDFDERDRFLLTLLRPHLAHAYRSSVQRSREPVVLTRRQLEILRMVQEGWTNLQIAHRADLSEGTVRTHLNNAYARLGVTSRSAAVLAVFGSSESWPRLT
jgi:DNA-binding CsgD family transcriptional regulator